jgi:hypothetical protein
MYYRTSGGPPARVTIQGGFGSAFTAHASMKAHSQTAKDPTTRTENMEAPRVWDFQAISSVVHRSTFA